MHEHDGDRALRAARALATRRERTQTLRRRVAALAVAIFVAAWAGIFVQLVGGRDPALASRASSRVVSQAIQQSSTADVSESGQQPSPAPASGQQPSPAPVTTRQS